MTLSSRVAAAGSRETATVVAEPHSSLTRDIGTFADANEREHLKFGPSGELGNHVTRRRVVVDVVVSVESSDLPRARYRATQ